MISNKAKRNIWFSLCILSAVAMVDRAIRVANGELEWWNLVSVMVIVAFCVKFFACYRRQVKRGNLYGPVNPLK
mgnify:CR=1 FL=1